MNLAEIYARHGQAGLEQLAEKADLPLRYIQRMLYVLNRRPRADRAMRLIEASRELWGERGALTVEGLTNPVPYKEAIEEAVRKGVADPKWMLREGEAEGTGVRGMRLADIYALHGQLGLDKLAEVAGMDPVYVRRLMYVTSRRPSVERAGVLIRASEKLWGKKNALTLEGLTNPCYFKDAIDEALERGIAHPTWILRRVEGEQRALKKAAKPQVGKAARPGARAAKSGKPTKALAKTGVSRRAVPRRMAA